MVSNCMLHNRVHYYYYRRSNKAVPTHPMPCHGIYFARIIFFVQFSEKLSYISIRPCLNVEIESVHRICLLTDSVDRSCFGS